ncbi:MAG TPA: hypothetical protein VF450_23425 [Noviherbaspirillum sp.]
MVGEAGNGKPPGKMDSGKTPHSMIVAADAAALMTIMFVDIAGRARWISQVWAINF